MPLPRRLIVHDERPGAYHVISRCVRRAYLCGDRAEHRREWVRDLIRQAANAFAVDVLAYAVMSNHLHIVVLTDPARVATWTPIEVATRWARAHPRTAPDGSPQTWSSAEIAERAADPLWIDTITATTSRPSPPPHSGSAAPRSAPRRQRPTGRRATVEQHHESTTAVRLVDPHDDRSRPNRAGSVLSEQVR